MQLIFKIISNILFANTKKYIFVPTIIAVIVAVACSLPGVFLVLRKMAMMSDAITHTILLGIVIAFFMPVSRAFKY